MSLGTYAPLCAFVDVVIAFTLSALIRSYASYALLCVFIAIHTVKYALVCSLVLLSMLPDVLLSCPAVPELSSISKVVSGR